MSEWRTLSLREAGVTLIDCVHKTPKAQQAGYPYVGIPDMKQGRINFSNARLISEDDYIEWTQKASPKRNDVILSRRTNPGVTAIDDSGTKFALGQNLVLLRANGTVIYPPFLRWMTQSPFWWEQISKFNNVGAVFDSLKCADIPKFELPVPPQDAQRFIASILGSLDNKIDLNRRTNETLEAMARALFRDWFVDFGPTRAKMAGQTPYLAPEIWELFPERLDDEGKPEGWFMFPLSSFCSLKKESLSPEKTPEIMFSHFSIPAFDKGGMPDLVYGEQIKSGKYVVPDDSILLSKLNPETPRIWFIPNNHTVHPQICSTEFMVLLPQTRELREFIYCAVSAEPFRDLLKSMVTGTSKSHQRVQPSAVMTIDCVLTDRKLPLRFGNVVSSFFSRMEKNMIENQNLSQLRDLLLPKLMSGEIHIRDAEKMVADAL